MFARPKFRHHGHGFGGANDKRNDVTGLFPLAGVEYCLPVGFELERPGFVEPGFDRALVIALDALGFEIDDRPLAS